MFDIPQKQCSKCEQSFPATTEFFSRHEHQKDKLQRQCKVCCKAYQQSYREVNKEQKRERDKRYYVENQAQIRERIEQYRKTHRTQVYETHKRYSESHEEIMRKSRRKYEKTEQGKIAKRANKHKRRARELMSPGTYTHQQLQEQLHRQKYLCYYCKVKLGEVWHADHVVPISRGGTNDISNIVASCPSCNYHKSNKMLHEWNGSGGRLL